MSLTLPAGRPLTIVRLADFVSPSSGGLRTALRELGAGYAAAGHRPVLIVPGREPGDRETDQAGSSPCPARCCPAPAATGLTGRRRLARLLRELAPDRLEVSDRTTLRWTVLLTACLPDPGAVLRLPRALAAPLARRQQGVNEVVHALTGRYGALHLHAADTAWTADPATWSVDRLHPGERGHRAPARAFHALLADARLAGGAPPGAEPQSPPPARGAGLWWMATRGTAWVARRSVDLLPQLLRLAAAETGHRVRGTTARLDLETSRAVASALAALSPPPAAHP
jgi:hypothetical protein